MNIQDAVIYGNKMLTNAGVPSQGDARILLAYTLGCDKLYLTVHKNCELTLVQQKKYENYIIRRANFEPVSYITGSKEFMSLNFSVNPNVLIPRPETELIVEHVMHLKLPPNAEILDICTGSGAIAVAIKHYLKTTEVYAVDISRAALETAQKNAADNSALVHFFEADALKPINLGKKFDIAVSNPPYIPKQVIDTLDIDVKNYEPSIALDGGKSGYIFYEAIIKNIDSVLKYGGQLVLEVGFDQAQSVIKLMENNFSDIGVIKDLAGIERTVYGTYTGF